MDSMERLCIATAFGKYVKEEIGDMRFECDRKVIADYERDGIKSRDARVNEMKTGTYTVVEMPSKTEEYPEITDSIAFAEWVAENPEVCTQFALQESVRMVDFAIAETGELPSGCEMREVVKPGRLSAQLKVDVEKVIEALGAELPGAVAGLLGGDTDGD